MSPSQSIRNKEWWIKLKSFVRKRDRGRCRICGDKYEKPGMMIVAHILPRRNYPELQKDPDNCVLLCAFCNSRYTEEQLRWKFGRNFKIIKKR